MWAPRDRDSSKPSFAPFPQFWTVDWTRVNDAGLTSRIFAMPLLLPPLQAKLAEQAERFDEMVEHMKAVASQPKELSVEERNLLSVAYKNVIGSRRASWRVISSIEGKDTVSDQLPLIRDYKEKIEMELKEICDDILKIIENDLIPNSSADEGKVFYYKMKGDYHRYLAEFQSADDRKASASAALEAYQSASELANQDLPPTHPIRLGLPRNFSVF
ncbi:unnamed protein product, partial [Phaeothamnion confervicola]